MHHRDAVAEAFDEVFDRQTPIRFSFRLDDDDALAIDYITQVREKLPQLLLMSGGLDPKPVCLTFSKGLSLLGPPDNRHFVAAYERSPMAIGLAVLAPARCRPLVMNIPHMKIQTAMPTLMDPGPLMTLRTLHDNNDSMSRLFLEKRIDLSDEALKTALKARFMLDAACLLAL